MKIYATILCLAAAIAVATPFFGASAQSGRGVVQTPQPTPSQTPTPEVTSPSGSDAKPGFVVDSSAEKYRLVFPTGFNGTFHKGKLYVMEYDPLRPSRYNNFIEQLNRAGEQGYRLLSAISSLPVAIVKQDKVQYEYAWVETSSDPLSVGLAFALKFAELAKRGFHVVGKLFVSRDCRRLDDNNEPPIIEVCEEKHLFLLEREKSFEKLVHFTVASSIPRWRTSKQRELLQTRIDEHQPEGYYPANLFSKFEILLEQSEKTDHPVAGKTDVRVLTSPFWRDDVQKKINELAQQGYRLALTNKGIAVMYRSAETTTPVSYIWLDPKKKEFGQELAKLQEKGAIYRMTYPSDNGTRHRLIFELKSVDDRQRREYRILKFGLQKMENATEQKVHTDLDASSKETIKIIEGLVKEGFVVRDLFVSDVNNILLERPVSVP